MAIVFCTILGISYFVGVAYFQTHFKIGTTINGFKCSMKTVEEAGALLSRSGESYALEIDTRNNGVEKISAESVGLTFDGYSELVNLLKAQDYRLWFLPETEDTNMSVDAYQIDKEKLDTAVNNLDCMQDIEKAQPAHVVETNDFYQVSPAVKGTELDIEKTKNVIETAFRQWEPSVNLEEKECYIDTDLGNEDVLQSNCDILNSIHDTVITYDFGDRAERIDFNVIKTNFIEEDGALNIDLIKNYLSELAQTYDTVGVERNFVTYDDRTVPLSGGDYGWKMDVARSAEELLKLIKAQTIDVVEPAYTQTAASRDRNDIGHSYLELDTQNKKAVLYVDGEPIVQTDAHFGNGLEQGFFAVHGKEESMINFKLGSIYPYEESASSFSGTNDIMGISSSVVAKGSIAIPMKQLTAILAAMDSTWPIIIY